MSVRFLEDANYLDSVQLQVGSSSDLTLVHDGSNSYIHHNGAGSLYMKADTGDINIINYTNDRDIILQSDDGSGGVTPYLTLDGSTAKSYFSTRLGVGITDPVSNLHVEEDSTATDATAGLTIENRGTGDAIAQFLLTGATRWVIGADNSDSDKFKIASSIDLASAARLAIDTSGNVGIGTTSPTAKLHVNGTFIVAEDSEKGLDINGQSYNYKIGDIDGGENQTHIEVDSPNSKTILHNSTLELGHASDTTIARASAGKVTIEGAPIQTTQMSMSHHNFFMNSTSTTADFFVPFNNLNESSNPTNAQYYNRMVAPYDGRIVKVVLHTTAAIGTACQVLFWVATSSGTFAPSAAETVTGVNLNTANTSATATFSGTSTAEFVEGDVVGVSIIKSTTATANMQVTVVWEYTL